MYFIARFLDNLANASEKVFTFFSSVGLKFLSCTVKGVFYSSAPTALFPSPRNCCKTILQQLSKRNNSSGNERARNVNVFVIPSFRDWESVITITGNEKRSYRDALYVLISGAVFISLPRPSPVHLTSPSTTVAYLHK